MADSVDVMQNAIIYSVHVFHGDPGPPGLALWTTWQGRHRGKSELPGDAIVGILQEGEICNKKNVGLLHFNSTSSIQKLLVCDGESWKVRA